jgi:phosphomevalonate kinase
MRVAAPGKLLLSGAYAVLEGAPALVMAVDRRAVADGDQPAVTPTPEVLAALEAEEAPLVDASALREGAFKLGLGSSAAMLVASLGVARVRAGDDLGLPAVRDEIFGHARRAHAKVQGGGSGVDVAASVYGGALAYTLSSATCGGGAETEPVTLPSAIVIDVFWCGAPAVTSGMRARVDALGARDGRAYRARLDAIARASEATLRAVRAGDSLAFVKAVGDGGDALLHLGRDADAPIFPPATLPLVTLAQSASAAFLPSGAGGGDVFVHVGSAPSSATFRAAAASAGMRLLPMGIDLHGVCLLS